MTEQINKKLHELLGLEWHERRIKCQTLLLYEK